MNNLKQALLNKVPENETVILKAIQQASTELDIIKVFVDNYGMDKDLYPDWLKDIEKNWANLK